MPERRFHSTPKSDELVEQILAETAKQARTSEVRKALEPSPASPSNGDVKNEPDKQ